MDNSNKSQWDNESQLDMTRELLDNKNKAEVQKPESKGGDKDFNPSV